MTMTKEVKRNDNARRLKFALTSGGVAQNLTGASVKIKFAGGIVVEGADVTIESPATAGIVSCSAAEISATVGTYDAEVEVTFADTTHATWPEGLDRPRTFVREIL